MRTKAQIVEDLNWITDRLSTQVRTVALGVLALAWGLLLGDKDPAKSDVLHLKWHLMGIGGVCVLVLVLDYLQYVAGYAETRGLLKTMESEKKENGQYDPKKLSYRLRGAFFALKQWTLAAAIVWMSITLGRWLWMYR